jgi:hypothetical protein
LRRSFNDGWIVHMPEPLIKDGKTFLPLERGAEISEELLAQAQWGQKTAPTKIYIALPGEYIPGDDLTKASGERRLIRAEGDEVVFNNGHIPLRRNARGEVIEWRNDIFLPTDAKGKSKGAEIRDRDYRRITKGIEDALIPGFNGGEYYPRDYGIYLPLPNPQAVIKLDHPIYIVDAFGPGDHQWLDQPVLRLQKKDDVWRIAGGINGPEFNHTWTTLGSLAQMDRGEARFHAQLALKRSERRFKLRHLGLLIRNLPGRLFLGLFAGRWISRPETPRRGSNSSRHTPT